jgi:hypothetical protein
LANKSECFEKFCNFHGTIEKVTGKKLVTLRTDNGDEYTSHMFSCYCLDHGIQYQFTQPYTPHYNGVAELKNQTLLDIVICFLQDGNLLASLWAEVISAACIITNLRSSKHSPYKTPLELFSGNKPSISNLCVFGSLAYVLITKPGRNKLDL